MGLEMTILSNIIYYIDGILFLIFDDQSEVWWNGAQVMDQWIIRLPDVWGYDSHYHTKLCPTAISITVKSS